MQEQILNYRLLRTRGCGECAFGMLAPKWRLLNKITKECVAKAQQMSKAQHYYRFGRYTRHSTRRYSAEMRVTKPCNHLKVQSKKR
jgi:hypothetical protein